MSDVRLLTLYKQHYLDDYSISMKSKITCIGYYDGLDLIKADKKYEGIILNLLGRTVIVDNIDNAVKLAKQNSYKFKIVTLKGDVINPSGAISGGSVANKTVSILGRGKEIKELEDELSQMKKKIEKK